VVGAKERAEKGKRMKGQHRPPPRISIPMDMNHSADVWVDVNSSDDEDDHNSPPENGYVDLASRSQSSASIYSQPSPAPSRTPSTAGLDLNEFEIEKDEEVQLKLPLSLPTSPITAGLEDEFKDKSQPQGQSQGQGQTLQVPGQGQYATPLRKVPSRLSLGMIPESEAAMEPAMPETPALRMYSPSPSVCNSHPNDTLFLPHTNAATDEAQSQTTERILRSRWSTSTLSSLHERELVKRIKEKEKSEASGGGMSTSSRLRFYFGRSRSGSKKVNDKRVSSATTGSMNASARRSASVMVGGGGGSRSLSPQSPSLRRMSPISPFFPFPSSPASSSPSHRHFSILPTPTTVSTTTTTYSHSPSLSRKEFTAGGRQPRSQRGRVSYDLVCSSPVVGGVGGDGVSRGASRSSTSSSGSNHEGSECGSSESLGGGSGLRRKPIPVEMFIKC